MDAAGVLRKRAKNPELSPPAMTGLATLAAGCEREAGRIEEDLPRPK